MSADGSFARSGALSRAISLAIVLALFLAACGGSGESASNEGSPDPTVAGATEERDEDSQASDGDTADGVTGEIAEAAADATSATEDGSDQNRIDAENDDQADEVTATGDAASSSTVPGNRADRSDFESADRSIPGAGPLASGQSAQPPVTIEPPKATPSTVPVVTTGCDGAGFGDGTTRIGVLVPDYLALIDTGFVPRVTPVEYRARYLASTFGANMRNDTAFPGSPFALPCGELELVVETYDPLDPATQRDACIALADGPGVLVVLSELEDRRGEGLSCLIEEAGIPVITAGSVTTDDLAAADGQLVSLRPPVDLLAGSAVQAFSDLALLDGQVVGVLGGDDDVSGAATDAVLAELAELDVDVVSAIVPSGTGVTDVWAEVPEVVDQFLAEEVTVVISMFDAVVNNALWDRMINENVVWQFLLVDATGVAEHDKVTRLPDEFNGLVFTSLNSHKEADRSDPASVECISDYAMAVSLLEADPDASGMLGDGPAFELPADVIASESTTTTTTTSTVPVEPGDTGETGETASADGNVDAGPLEDGDDGIETALREQLGEDRPPGPACALVTTAVRAVLAAGDDLNTATFVAALHQLGPTNLFIEGSGSLGPDKNYLADFGQVLRFERYVEPITVELAAPCDSPDNCWREIDDPSARKRPLVGSPDSDQVAEETDETDETDEN